MNKIPGQYGKMKINDKLLDYTAALSKLEIREDEREAVAASMSEIIEYMALMNELDTENVEPMSHVLPLNNVFREDETVQSADRDELLANAPEKKDGCFKVYKTVV